MQKSNEIKSSIENIRYYNEELKKLIKEQLDLDLKRGNELGVRLDPGSIRYDSLGCIYMVCGLFDTYIINIEANLKNAESQDKLLNKPEDEHKIANEDGTPF